MRLSSGFLILLCGWFTTSLSSKLCGGYLGLLGFFGKSFFAALLSLLLFAFLFELASSTLNCLFLVNLSVDNTHVALLSVRDHDQSHSLLLQGNFINEIVASPFELESRSMLQIPHTSFRIGGRHNSRIGIHNFFDIISLFNLGLSDQVTKLDEIHFAESGWVSA